MCHHTGLEALSLVFLYQTGKVRAPAPFNSFCRPSPALLCPKSPAVCLDSLGKVDKTPVIILLEQVWQLRSRDGNDLLKATQQILEELVWKSGPSSSLPPSGGPFSRSEGEKHRAFLREDWPPHPSWYPDPSGICKG